MEPKPKYILPDTHALKVENARLQAELAEVKEIEQAGNDLVAIVCEQARRIEELTREVKRLRALVGKRPRLVQEII